MQKSTGPLCALLALAASLLLASSAAAETIGSSDAKLPPSYQPTPYFAEAVAAGSLPAVSARLPERPMVMSMNGFRQPGKPGGNLRFLIGKAKDTKLIGVYGYARLVGYDHDFTLQADLLESLETKEGRIFTLRLRKGHRWSDGQPFTSEDFRYFWEEVARNEELSPSGPPKVMRLGDELAKVEILDETTVRYSWSKPNPFFVPALARASPLFIYRPAHYLKTLHFDHADKDALDKMVEQRGMRSWAQLHNTLGHMYRFQNPDLPTLQPWRLVTAPPAQRFVAERNPYYHRVDEAGWQLPYIDTLNLYVTSSSLIPAKTGAGESDLQARGLNFSDTPFLKAGESRGKFKVTLWQSARGSQLALYPNLNAADPMWRELLRDARFRRALSLAIDRAEINQSMYFGIALTGNNTVLPGSPLYKEDYRNAWTGVDLQQANALLDEIGLTARDDEGLRLLPDGRPLQITVESAGENTEETDILELVSESWRKAGVKLFTKPSQREVLRNRIFAGETLMAIWFGLENGVPTPVMSPEEFVPVHQQSYQWPKWGQYFETSGGTGEPVDMPAAEELLALYDRWQAAPGLEAKSEAWHRILEINAEQVYTIGLVAAVPQPVVATTALRNLPEKAIYNWDPGAHFGIYRTDCLWLEN